MAYPGWETRNALAPFYRRIIYRNASRVPFPHQAQITLALEGYELTEQVAQHWPTYDEYKGDVDCWGWVPGVSQDVMMFDESIERRIVWPRKAGLAAVAADLAAYKGGKSQWSADQIAPELVVPGVMWELIGERYSTSDMEFRYILENLFSEKGLNIPLKSKGGGLYAERILSNPDKGMLIQLSNRSELRTMSWDQAYALKGKTRDGYLYAECYQMGGFHIYTDIKQNLQQRHGKAIFPTTPDHPWVDILDTLGRDKNFPQYFCISGVPRKQNPYTFSETEMEQDRFIMTSEKHGINWEGKLGQYIGSVFKFRRGDRQFTPKTHPELWKDPNGPAVVDNLKIPVEYMRVAGGDTGTNSSAVWCAFSPPDPKTNEPTCFVLWENPSYRYVGTDVEDLGVPPSDWYAACKAVCNRFHFRNYFWCDINSQFRRDASFYGVAIGKNDQGREARTEITREFFQHNRIFFAPWLDTLPYEIEMAVYPPKGSSTGGFLRVKERDHTLDGLEHVCSRRPKGRTVVNVAPGSYAEKYFQQGHRWKNNQVGNPWVG